MSHSHKSLEELYVNLILEDGDEGEIVVGKNEVTETKLTHVLVGKFLTEKNINFHVMQNVMPSIWRPKEEMVVHDLGAGLDPHLSSFIRWICKR